MSEPRNHQQLARAVFEICHLTGEFLLRSGQTSHEYFDKYQFEAKPDILRDVAREMAQLIPEGTDMLAGLEIGGIPLSTAVSLESGLPQLLVRKKAKEYGTCKLAEGPDFAGKRLCIIEDVITTGGQVKESTQLLREAGAIVEHVICVIYRGPENDNPFAAYGLNMQAVFTAAELKSS